MNGSNYIKLEMKNKSENVGVATVALASFASQLDFTVSELEEIKVAVSEAVSNAVIHAYQGDGIIEVTGIIYPNDVFEVRVRDFGKGIDDIEKAMEATYTTTKDRMGLGLTFMDSLMDELNIESKPNEGTCVIMKKAPERGANES